MNGEDENSVSQAKAMQAKANDAWRSYTMICRLCLQKDGFMLGIFNNVQGTDKSISKKIVDCMALSVCQGDGLPNVICHRCLYKIEFCLEFRQLCFLSDATLRQLAGISKDYQEQGGGSQVPPIDQIVNGDDENVVMVVDPNAVDYESNYESDEKAISDSEINELENKNVSMCKFCDYAFTNKEECDEHEVTAHNIECPYNCSTCVMNFADRLVYSAHMKNVHKNDKPYNCPQCDRTFARRSDLRKHTIVHTGVKPFTCTVCLKSFSRNTNLSKHMRIHSGTKPFVCPKCPRTFTSKGDLTRHAIIHTGQRPFRCNYCHLSFGRKDKLLRHEKRHWPQENSEDKAEELQLLREDIYKTSSVTGESEDDPEKQSLQSAEDMVIALDPFGHNETLQPVTLLENEHEPLKNEATDNVDYSNNEANDSVEHSNNTSFTEDDENTDLAEHQVIEDTTETQNETKNSTSRVYRCTLCTKRFVSPDNLKYHMARHTGIRPFPCHVCNKSFIRKRELDRHVTTHTGVKPFKCPKCIKSFGRKDKLIRHMRIHDRRDGFSFKKGLTENKYRKPIFLQQKLQQQQE